MELASRRPISLAGKQVISEEAIKDWNPPTTSDANLTKLLKDFYYIDTGVQF